MNFFQQNNNKSKLKSFSGKLFNNSDRLLFYFLLAIPLINAVADSTIYYFVEPDKESGLHPGIIRGVILILYILLFGIKRIRNERVNYFILAFLAYLFILLLFSSNIRYAFLSGYIKWFIPLMMFPVGFYFFKNVNSLLLLNRIYVYAAIIICSNLVVAQIIKFGLSAYVEKSFYTGGAGVGITNQLSLILLTYPFLLRKRISFTRSLNWLVYINGVLSIVFVLLAMKRAAIISLMAGVLIYLYFTQSRIRFIKYLAVIIFFFYLIFPLIQDVFTERYETRMRQMENIEKEARYQEILYVFQEFREADISQKLFGAHLFNTGEYFGRKYFNTNRMIHSDFFGFLYGAGVIGIFLYLAIYYVIISMGVKFRRILKHEIIERELLAIFFAILVATFLISFTGSGTIGERCLVFLYLGAISGTAKQKIKSLFLVKKFKVGSISLNLKKF